MARAPRLQAGDVFEINLGASGFAYGQIVTPGIVFQIALSLGLFTTPQEISTLTVDRPFAFIWTTDGEFTRNMWRVVGNRDLPPSIPRPRHKVFHDGVLTIETFDKRLLRRASPKDEVFYDFRLSVSSASVGTFLLAHHGRIAEAPDPKHYVEYQKARENNPPLLGKTGSFRRAT